MKFRRACGNIHGDYVENNRNNFKKIIPLFNRKKAEKENFVSQKSTKKKTSTAQMRFWGNLTKSSQVGTKIGKKTTAET